MTARTYTFGPDGLAESGDPLSILDGGDELGALAQAGLISLLSWRRAEADDPIPVEGERMGWWADGLADGGDRIGSRLWLLARTAATESAATAARQYALEALQWMLADGLAARVDCTAELVGQAIGLTVEIWRDDGSGVTLRFADLWSSNNGN